MDYYLLIDPGGMEG